MTQKQLVRDVLGTHGSITHLESAHLGVVNINDVIMRLRKDGMDIETQTRHDKLGRKYTAWSVK